MRYDVMLDGHTVGWAEVEAEGLYCRIRCQCRPEKTGFYRLQLQTGKNIRDLGTCIPRGPIWEVSTRIPEKQIGSGPVSFSLLRPEAEVFVPLCETEPFAGLARLRVSRFAVQGGRPGLIQKQDPR